MAHLSSAIPANDTRESVFVTIPVFNFDHCFKRRVLSFPVLGCHTPSVVSMPEFSRHLTHKISKCQMSNSVLSGT